MWCSCPLMNKDIQEEVEKCKVSLCRVSKQQQQRTYAVISAVKAPIRYGYDE